MVSQVRDRCTVIRVQSWDMRSAAPARVEQALGTTWPRAIGTVATGRADILCIGPTDWLVLAGDPDAAPLLQMLTEAFAGSALRATNLSSALTRIELDGEHVRALLAKACALDLHPQAFPPGRCARTRFAGMPVVVRCIQAANFECIVSLSYSEYLIAWLSDAALEFGGALA